MKKLFLILALVAICATPALADRSMAGGTCTMLGPTDCINPGDTVTFEFMVYNGSVDTEWTADVIFTFPTCCTVVSGYYDDSVHVNGDCVFNFSFDGNVASFLDGDEGYGEIYDDDQCLFYVEVTVDCAAGNEMVHWFQQGDVWGDDPHFIEGDIEFGIGTTATDHTTFSSVKALY